MSIYWSDGASSLENQAGYVTYPLSFGLWFYCPATAPTEKYFGWGDVSSTQCYHINHAATTLQFTQNNGADSNLTIGTVAVGWNFAFVRITNVSNIVAGSINAAGLITVAGTSTPISPTITTPQVRIGKDPSTGTANAVAAQTMVAEVWQTNNDIYPCSVIRPFDEDFIQKLAFEGPWSLPQVASGIIFYNSFEQYTHVNQLNTNNVNSRNQFNASGYSGASTWVQNGTGLSVGPPPPLSSTYVRPFQSKRFLMV